MKEDIKHQIVRCPYCKSVLNKKKLLDEGYIEVCSADIVICTCPKCDKEFSL